MSWLIQGFEETEPRPGKIYFPVVASKCQHMRSVLSPTERPYRFISLFIPCYNEEASALKRTIKSLKALSLRQDVVLEVLVAMDGIDQMASSMRAYITELFGISTEENSVNNPFVKRPEANTVIVEPALDESIGSSSSRVQLSLVIKRTNRRKVNSQMWWLRGHAKEIQCEFAFGTDCGIIFEKKNLSMMLERLDSDKSLSAVSGYLRVMSSAMQSDGPLELCTNPLGWFLRQLQSYDIEVRTLSGTRCMIYSRWKCSHPVLYCDPYAILSVKSVDYEIS
jgi:cellulose synthase/poly-beta-1,6-N-acetylglucosamine synthase-like glycosyltransferase